MAASLLTSLGLPELITHNLADYEALALRLARDPVSLKTIKAKLSENRVSMPLFNTDRYRRHLEAAFTSMWERRLQERIPEGFTVPLLES